jgi:hypothetical protein
MRVRAVTTPNMFAAAILPSNGTSAYLDMLCWLGGTNPSTLERKRARAHQIGETE